MRRGSDNGCTSDAQKLTGATHPSGLAMTVTFSPDTDMDSVRIDFSSEVTAIVHAIAQVQDNVEPGPAGLLFH